MIRTDDTHEQKLQRAIASRSTRLSVALVANVALELSRQADGTVPKEVFKRNFDWVFDLLTRADEQLVESYAEGRP